MRLPDLWERGPRTFGVRGWSRGWVSRHEESRHGYPGPGLARTRHPASKHYVRFFYEGHGFGVH